MTTIGAAWIKQREDSNEFYYSFSLDRAILPFTLTEDKRLTLKENKNKNSNEKAPDFYLDVFVPLKQEDKKE